MNPESPRNSSEEDDDFRDSSRVRGLSGKGGPRSADVASIERILAPLYELETNHGRKKVHFAEDVSTTEGPAKLKESSPVAGSHLKYSSPAPPKKSALKVKKTSEYQRDMQNGNYAEDNVKVKKKVRLTNPEGEKSEKAIKRGTFKKATTDSNGRKIVAGR